VRGILFKKHFIDKILSGEKTQTRRVHKKPLYRGELVAVKTSYSKCSGIVLRILKVWKERLGDISEADARKEGCGSIEGFKQEWIRINKVWDPNLEVTVYEFEVVR